MLKERIEELLERAVGDRRRHVEEWLVELPERLQDLVSAFGRPGIRPADDQDLAAVQVLRERGACGNAPEDGIHVHLVGRTQGEIPEPAKNRSGFFAPGKQARQTPPSARLNAGEIRTR